MKTIAIVTNTIPSYRVPLFYGLANIYQLTVFHHDKNLSPSSFPFATKYVKLYSCLGLNLRSPRYLLDLLYFDLIVIQFDIRYLELLPLLLFLKKFKKIFLWGIGVRASLQNSYDSPSVLDTYRAFLITLSYRAIFYSRYPVVKYAKLGLPKKKLTAALNTCTTPGYLPPTLPSPAKDSFLFVGTLYKQKYLDSILYQYSIYASIVNQPLRLRVVGDGPDLPALVSLTATYGISDLVTFHGSLYSHIDLNPIYSTALATLTLFQAGLTVCQSMSYGVPCVAYDDAITGGELFNIVHRQNGLIFSNQDVSDILLFCHNNSSLFSSLSNNAYDYYQRHLTMDRYIESFAQALS